MGKYSSTFVSVPQNQLRNDHPWEMAGNGVPSFLGVA
jgi:hypothetical protein